jgi:hypothetical protein
MKKALVVFLSVVTGATLTAFLLLLAHTDEAA